MDDLSLLAQEERWSRKELDLLLLLLYSEGEVRAPEQAIPRLFRSLLPGIYFGIALLGGVAIWVLVKAL